MSIEMLVESLGLGAVALLSWYDAAAQSAPRRLQPPRARPQASLARRCPYCHGCFADDAPDRLRVRCVACSTPHHADCWADHAKSCSVHGCSCRAFRAARLPLDPPEAEGDAAPDAGPSPRRQRVRTAPPQPPQVTGG